MGYSYEFLNKITQLGVTNYTLKLTDDTGNAPISYIPVILNNNEDTEENLMSIAINMINQCPVSEIQSSE